MGTPTNASFWSGRGSNLNLVAEYVKQGIFQAGGTPVEFGVMAPCDGIAQGHIGMHYIFDAVVLLCSCDKIVPGMLMAAARLDVPPIVVVGGPMEGGCIFDNRPADTTSLTGGLGMLRAGKIDEQTYTHLEDAAAPTCGSCSFHGGGDRRTVLRDEQRLFRGPRLAGSCRGRAARGGRGRRHDHHRHSQPEATSPRS